MCFSQMISATVVGCAIALPALSQTPELAVDAARPVSLPQPAERATFSSPELAVPGQRELVSILKRRLPESTFSTEAANTPEWLQDLIQRLARENLPNAYVRDKDWGKQDRRWDGLDIHHKGGLRVYTKRKWKAVNHGTWKRYEIRQADPDHSLLLRLENVHESGEGKLAFELVIESKVRVSGRLAKWSKGVKLYSVSADAQANVALRVWCELGMTLDVSRFPPDVVFFPEVSNANLHIQDFQLERVSKFDGPLIKHLSRSAHKVLLDKIDEKRDRLPAKINRQLAKNQDKMRLSLADLATRKWQDWVGIDDRS